MNFKKNFLVFYIILSIIIISFINIRNTKKVNINIFTWQSNNLSLGNLITYSYIAGISFNTLLILLIIKDGFQTTIKSNDDEFLKKDEFEDELNNIENKSERPPERNIKESQPTISVNYRVIGNNKDDQMNSNNDSNLKNRGNKIYEDWEEEDNDW